MQDSIKSPSMNPYPPPQVYSPLPMRTHVVFCVDLALNNEILLVDSEELYTRKFKCYRFLLDQFNDAINNCSEIG